MAQARPLAVDPPSTQSQILPSKPAPVSLDRHGLASSHSSPRGRGRGSNDLHSRGSGRGVASSFFSSAPRRLDSKLPSGSLPPKTVIPPSDTPTLSYSKGDLKGAVSLRKPPPTPLKATSLTTPSISSPDPDRERTRSQGHHKHSTPTTPRHDRDKLRPPPVSPGPLSATAPHNRSRRGGGRNKKNKDGSSVDPPTTPLLPADNPKPLSIEDAVAQLKKNPFDGGPLLKSPKPAPLLSPGLKSIPFVNAQEGATTSNRDQAPSKAQPPSSVEQVTEYAQTLTISASTDTGTISRPHTPSTHIDWAGDDDDGSLPDLDDWVTPAPTATFVLPEVKTMVDMQEVPIVSIKVEPPTSPKTASTLSIKGAAQAKDEEKATRQQTELPDTQTGEPQPTVADTESVRVTLPSQRAPPQPRSAPPHHPILRPSPSDASLRQPPLSDYHSQPRPLSFSSFGRDRERLHARTRSLPQDKKVHHASRPVISAVGLSRISKSLASGTNAVTSTKLKDAET